MVSITRSGTEITLYTNGGLTDNQSVPIPLQTTIWYSIGGTEVGVFFEGSFDEFRIYNRALTQEEITVIYDSKIIQPSIPTDGLLASYPFNGNANDETVNENHGNVIGANLTSGISGDDNGDSKSYNKRQHFEETVYKVRFFSCDTISSLQKPL